MSRPATELPIRGVISRLPVGLLGFLGIKNGGEYPRHLVPAIAPTWDMLELLAGGPNNEELHTTAAASGAAGTTNSFTPAAVVPVGELWFVRFAGLRVVTGAGDSGSFSLGTRKPQNGTNIIPISNQVTVAASLQVWQTMTTGPFFMGPGEELVYHVATVAAAPTLRLAVRFARMPM